VRRQGLAAAIGYALGLLPTAQLVARAVSRSDVDVTSKGTGNPGAANVAALLGKQPGAAVLVGDVAKAVVAGRLGRRIGGSTGLHIASTASLVGHCYPVTRRGRGGKGVATSIGQVLVSFPGYLPLDAAVAGAAYYHPRLRRDPGVAVAVSSGVWVAAALLWWRRRWPNPGGPPPDAAMASAAAVSSLVIALRFRQTAREAGALTDEPPTDQQPRVDALQEKEQQ